MRTANSSVVAMLVVLSMSTPGAGSAYADSSCGPLTRLVGLADTQFKRLRGYHDPRLRAWVATYRMPGTSHCLIQDADHFAYYACKWLHDPEAATVTEAYTRLLEQVTRCLNVEGSDRNITGPDSELTRFGIAGSEATVAVGKSESASAGHFVTLDIVPIAFRDLTGP